MKKINILFILFLVTFILTSFQSDKVLEVFGTYTYKTKTSGIEILHRIDLKEPDLCIWQTVTKRDKKEKCKRTGDFKTSGSKILITWSKNECENCGTYANWYGAKECNIDTLILKESSLWTKDTTPLQLTKTK